LIVTPDDDGLVAACREFTFERIEPPESVRHIAEIAAISGLTLDDVLPASSREMPHEVTLNEDGTATLA
jgi:hypothetical protein